ncbi:putative transferase [Helianthus annuus]|uniref:Putative leucine-rich repeat domain, L domain-like protein n=1 Tax=Helianthus annuus TaxID=4232 RepID=A0A251TY26_HELAN|nr:leucine-rich repeat receptor-like protein kinase PEPR1 [Helianthus annuus]KAF5791298.1 putative transferase [Helianthus annuus]KAJ0534816.1 putative transferase [Helianthus annuus]KAJ0542782.1 putative transferase [Helianthus annuus]KAJ0707833.1 putative transferase [Helianthus annuus]KAJ0711818.1 putative transferase [Helianthus annuus]
MAHLSSSSKLLHFFICFIQLSFHGYSVTHWEDIQSLKHFRNDVVSTSITPGSCLSTWDFTLDPCDSLSTDKFTCGIRCDVLLSNISRVTELTLDQAGYSGTLTPSLNLPYLQTLDLTNNFFTGPIPSSFSKLTRLVQLSLSSNSFTESIPDSLPDSLEELLLDNNNLTGPIPHTLNNLKNLKRLELQGNKLTGEFPNLSQLSNLNFLDVSNNLISGDLPATSTVTFPVNLIELTMRNNSLQGNIPASLVNNSVYLQVLDLSYNNLSGTIPPELFTHRSLQQLTLANNELRWVETPANWGSNSELIAVDLSNNDIHGFLPGFMGWMPKLTALSLENNKFSGMIPTQYAVKAVAEDNGFERLLLGGNYLFGLIPGPLLRLKAGSGVTIRLGGNCLYECPESFYFCGGVQKSLVECKSFTPVIP